jgi:DnaJ-class molecular chaperone
MFEVIAAAIASITAITCTGLWLTNRVMEREQPASSKSAGKAKIYPAQATVYPCALCNGYGDLAVKFDSDLGLMSYKCPTCKGQYHARTNK